MIAASRFDPQPVERCARDRAARPARLRADDRARRRRRRLAVRPPAGAAGVGTRDDAASIALWAVPAGVDRRPALPRRHRLGAVQRRPRRHRQDLAGRPRHPRRHGSLGILVGVCAARTVAGIPLGPALTAAAPALPLAQAIGRWGNWFNQELFGGPTDLPWALEIDDDNRRRRLPAGHHLPPDVPLRIAVEPGAVRAAAAGSIGASGCARAGCWRSTSLGYGIGRFWVEGLRIDAANEVGGLRLNQWIALVLIAAVRRLPARRLGPPPQRPPAGHSPTRADELGDADDRSRGARRRRPTSTRPTSTTADAERRGRAPRRAPTTAPRSATRPTSRTSASCDDPAARHCLPEGSADAPRLTNRVHHMRVAGGAESGRRRIGEADRSLA